MSTVDFVIKIIKFHSTNLSLSRITAKKLLRSDLLSKANIQFNNVTKLKQRYS